VPRLIRRLGQRTDSCDEQADFIDRRYRRFDCDADSHALNAKLILLLANHVGDIDVLKEAFFKARSGMTSSAQD
jgi:hypothetical protein